MIMPLQCLMCKKDIPLSEEAMREVSYTHYSYCETCLRQGLHALRTIRKIDECIQFHGLRKKDEFQQTGFETFIIEQVDDVLGDYAEKEGEQE